MRKVKAFTSLENKLWSMKYLIDDCTVITDGYRPFSQLCDMVDIHHSINTVRIYKDPDNKFFHWVNTMIGNEKKSNSWYISFNKPKTFTSLLGRV